MTNIYFIGGSPCSGKSTVAEILAKKSESHYFKVDDYLEKYVKSGASKGYPICKKQAEMTVEQMWMREPLIQYKEEIEIYHEIFEFVLSDLKQIKCRNIISEGAAYLPELMFKAGVSSESYVSITPIKEFQISNYKKREWVSFVLEGCSDKAQAFCNWMDRDALFADEIRKQCHETNYCSINNDGIITIDELVEKVSEHYGWGDSMGKKKKEHVIFDQMLKQKKSIPISKVNKKVKCKKEKG